MHKTLILRHQIEWTMYAADLVDTGPSPRSNYWKLRYPSKNASFRHLSSSYSSSQTKQRLALPIEIWNGTGVGLPNILEWACVRYYVTLYNCRWRERHGFFTHTITRRTGCRITVVRESEDRVEVSVTATQHSWYIKLIICKQKNPHQASLHICPEPPVLYSTSIVNPITEHSTTVVKAGLMLFSNNHSLWQDVFGIHIVTSCA